MASSVLSTVSANPSPSIPQPIDRFGFHPGADRRLIRWDDLCAYFRDVAAESDRVDYTTLGSVTGERDLILLTISSAENLDQLDTIKAVQQRLADQRPPLSDEEREDLLLRGKTICLTTCSIHPTEVGGTMMTPEFVYHLATDQQPDTLAILDNVVLLLVPSLNPFGWDLVCDWYEETLDGPFEGSQPPRLYHPVAGHDNNRDWFMHVLPETSLVVSRVHNAWHPHIVHDLHQMQPTGPRYFVPPFIDPYDPNVDPEIQWQARALGTEMATELASAGKTGVATSTIFDAYSPSRSYQHYHGGVRILSEAANARIASPITLRPDQLVEARGFNPREARSTHPVPWPGGIWSLCDIVDYNHIAVRSVLNHAGKYRRRWVQNFATMQQRALERTHPFAYVIPALDSQTDPASAAELLAVLEAGQVEVEKSNAAFSTATLDFPAGTYIVRVAQPFGRYAKTLLEVQPYPASTSASAKPYDITAHNLPLQMGVACHEAVEPFEYDGALAGPLEPPAGTVLGTENEPKAFLIPASSNASVLLANELLEAGGRLRRVVNTSTVFDLRPGTGAYVVDHISPSVVRECAQCAGVNATALSASDRFRTVVQTAPRVGLYRSWRGNAIDAGWTEHVLAAYGFRPTDVRNRDFRRGNLHTRFDTIVLAHEPPEQIINGNSTGEYPPKYAGGIGDVGAANLRLFAEQGGTVVALGAATSLVIEALYLPVTNALSGLTEEEFSSPGSMVRILIDPAHPIGWGFEREAVGMFVESPAFDIVPPGDESATAIARYPLSEPLVAGWMHGSRHLCGRTAVVEVEVGRGRAILIGIRPQFRAQARGTYRLLFNAVLRSTQR